MKKLFSHIAIVLIAFLSPPLFAEYYLETNGFYPDVEFSGTVEANGAAYGSQSFDADNHPYAVNAVGGGYQQKYRGFDVRLGIAGHSYKYKTPVGAAASADIASNDQTILDNQTIIDAEEAKPAPDQQIIDNATALINDATNRNGNIKAAHKRTASATTVAIGVSRDVFAHSSYRPYVGASAYIPVQTSGAIDMDPELFAEAGVRLGENAQIGLMANDHGAFATGRLLF